MQAKRAARRRGKRRGRAPVLSADPASWVAPVGILMVGLFAGGALTASNVVATSRAHEDTFPITLTQLAPPECAALTLTNLVLATGGMATGTGGGDLILGTDGADAIEGRGGDDCIVAGDGPDTVWGDAGSDVLLLGGASDIAEGGGGRDTIHGGAGDDDLDGGRSRDSCDGGSGVDTLTRCEIVLG